MIKFCGNCGMRITQKGKYCGFCGKKLETDVVIPVDENRKQLTNDIINQDLHNQRHTVKDYLFEVFLLGLFILVVALGGYHILIMAPFWLLSLIRMIIHDVRRSQLQYYIIEKPCIGKKFVEHDDSPDEWQLWFENKSRNLHVAVGVEQKFYDLTEINEEFYVVFLEKDKVPCLCYRKSEWICLGV